MYGIDTNILVYAHNSASPWHNKAKKFVEQIIGKEDKNGLPVVGLPLQVCAEFINVCTRKILGKPLSIIDASNEIRRYCDFLEIPIIYPKSTQLQTFLTLLESTSTRKKNI